MTRPEHLKLYARQFIDIALVAKNPINSTKQASQKSKLKNSN